MARLQQSASRWHYSANSHTMHCYPSFSIVVSLASTTSSSSTPVCYNMPIHPRQFCYLRIEINIGVACAWPLRLESVQCMLIMMRHLLCISAASLPLHVEDATRTEALEPHSCALKYRFARGRKSLCRRVPTDSLSFTCSMLAPPPLVYLCSTLASFQLPEGVFWALHMA